jgi:hypothetical protein
VSRTATLALLVAVALASAFGSGCGGGGGSNPAQPGPGGATTGPQTLATPPSGGAPGHADADLLWQPTRFCARRALHGRVGVCSSGDRWDVTACVDTPGAGPARSLRNGAGAGAGTQAVVGSFEVEQGDRGAPAGGDRCEIILQTRPITGMTPARGRPATPGGEVRFFAFDALYDESLQRPSSRQYQTVGQWHNSTNLPGCPAQSPLKIAVAGPSGSKRLEVHALQCVRGQRLKRRVLFRTPLKTGAWHHWLFEIKWSADPAVGYVRIWYDGQRVGDPSCQPDGRCKLATLYTGRGGAVAFNGFKLGNYRAHEIPFATLVRFRNVRVALTRGAVADG